MFIRMIAGVTVSALLSLPPPTAAQQPTLADRVAASGGKPVTVLVLREDRAGTMAELSQSSDLVVQATLTRLRSYVSDNNMTVFTDYEIVPARILHSRVSSVAAAPGPQPRLTLTVLGGETIINGTEVTVRNSKLKPIKQGAVFLIFANRVKAGESRYLLTKGSAGIFEVINGERVEPLFKRIDPDPEVDGVALPEIVRRIQTAVTATK